MDEKVLIIIKPDALQRGLMGQVITRFENKGLKIIGAKMVKVSDVLLEDHYSHIADKPFFQGIKDYMQSSPVILMVLSGINAVSATRLIVGSTDGAKADAGTIRGDFSLSIQSNLVHASDTVENGEEEVKRFFDEGELFNYEKIDMRYVYSDKHF